MYAGEYKLKLDERSFSSVVMLDVVLTKRQSGIGVTMHAKPTVQGIPLCSTSMHSTSIHKSWPNARVRHYNKICTDSYGSKVAIGRFRYKMRKYVPLHVWLENHVRTPGIFPDRKLESESSWIVMPFHRCFEIPLVRQSLARIQAHFEFLGIGELRPRISWCNGFRSIASRIGATYHSFTNECCGN